MAIPTQAIDLTALRTALTTYWESEGLMLDVRFFSTTEWWLRGEPYGNDALMTVTTEGALSEELNHVRREGKDRFDVSERTREICEAHGTWFELGFAWSLHIYKLEPIVPGRWTLRPASRACRAVPGQARPRVAVPCQSATSGV